MYFCSIFGFFCVVAQPPRPARTSRRTLGRSRLQSARLNKGTKAKQMINKLPFCQFGARFIYDLRPHHLTLPHQHPMTINKRSKHNDNDKLQTALRRWGIIGYLLAQFPNRICSKLAQISFYSPAALTPCIAKVSMRRF